MNTKTKRVSIFLALVLILGVFDIYTKHLVFEHFSVVILTSAEQKLEQSMQELSPGVFVPWAPPYRPIKIIPSLFNIHIVLNRGAVWGIMQGQKIFLTVVSLIAILFIFYLLLFKPEMEKFWFPLALIMSGAIGNLWDRFYFGGVRDFLDFYWGKHHWPTFNFADVFIVVGVSTFLLIEFVTSAKEKKETV